MPTYAQEYGKNIKETLSGIGDDILKTLLAMKSFQELPTKLPFEAGKGFASALGTEVGKGPSPFEAAKSGATGAAKQVLSPYQKGVSKALEESGKSHGLEAIMQGVPPQHIEQQAGLSPQMNLASLMASPAQGYAQNMSNMQSGAFAPTAQPQAIQPQTAPQQSQGDNILGKLLSFLYQPSSTDRSGAYQPSNMLGGFITESSADSLAQQQRLNLQPESQIALKKREAEEVPLSKAKKEEISLDTQKELLKLKMTLDQKGLEGLPGEQATKFSLLLEGRDAVTEIDKLVGTGDIGGIAASQKFTPDFFKSPAQRQLQLAIETSIDSRTRVETGAAMAKGELEREAKKMMPKIGESKGTWRKRIGRSFDFFNRSISIADPTGAHERRAMGARDRYAQSDLRQQALAELARRKGASNA